MVPSWAVTTTVMMFSPISSPVASLGEPLTTAAPFTVTVALGSVTVGVTVTLATLFGTVAVYVCVAESKAGVSATSSVPSDSTNALKVASIDVARVSATV